MMGSDHYCLKWNNHWTNLLRVFNSLLQSQTFVDITLACEGRHLKAHRLVLSACSPYFKDLLISHPDRHPIIILKDVRYKELETLVQFIYNGEVSVEQHELTSLLCTAKELQIKGLADNKFGDALPTPIATFSKGFNEPFCNSTNLSSIHLQSKSDDQPTNLTVKKKVDLFDNVSPKSPLSNGEPLDLHSKRASSPNREASPDPKRRRLSSDNRRGSPFQEPESTSKSQTPEVIAGPSGLSRPASEEKEFSALPSDLSTKDGRPRVCVIKEPKEKPPDALIQPVSTHELTENDSMNSYNPEHMSTATTNGTKTPSPDTPITSSLTLIGSTTTGSHSPMFFPQNIGIPGYPPSLSLLQSGLMEQQAVSQAMGSGFLQTNNLLNFVDFLKAVGRNPPNLAVPGSPGASKSPNKDYESVLTCSICARVMPSSQVLEEHIRIHEEDKPYNCDQCGQRYKYQSAFQRHKDQNHTAKLPGEKPYRCDVCGQCFKYHKSFTKHRSNHDLLDSFMKNEPDGTVRALHDAYFPGFFHKHFNRSEPIKEEKDDSLDEKDIRSASENGDIKDEEIEVPDVPDESETSETGKFLYCVHCKSTFKDHKTFQGHCSLSVTCSSDTLKEVSIGDEISLTSIPSPTSPQDSPSNIKPKINPCTSSMYRGLPSTGDPSILNLSKIFNIGSVSKVDTNDEERPFKCQYCQKGFKGRENLKLHIRTHTGEKPYNCGVCGKAFGGRSDMNRHLRIHTGEKPYPCKVCGKKFARADYLSKHITTHLGIPFAKPVHSLQQSLQNLENMQNLQSQGLSPQILSQSPTPVNKVTKD